LFGLGFSSQEGATIAGGQVLAMNEVLTALHHGQIGGSAIAEDFGRGAAVADLRLDLQIDGGPHRQELLQLLTGSGP